MGRDIIKVVLADDHKLVRDGVKALISELAPDMQIVGEVASGKQLLDLLEHTQTDIVLTDIDMPEMNGLEAARYIQQLYPGVKVIMLTMAENERSVREAIQAGAQGYLFKTSGSRELLQAIRSVYEGEEYFSTELTKMLLQRKEASGYGETHAQAKAQALPADISSRELEVLQLIGQGYTNAQIGDMLFTSKRTVESHRQHLLEKTGCNNTATLIRYAIAHNLLS